MKEGQRSSLEVKVECPQWPETSHLTSNVSDGAWMPTGRTKAAAFSSSPCACTECFWNARRRADLKGEGVGMLAQLLDESLL